MREIKLFIILSFFLHLNVCILGKCTRFNFIILLLLEEDVHCFQFLINIQYSIHACICVYVHMSVGVIHSCMYDCVFMTATLTLGV